MLETCSVRIINTKNLFWIASHTNILPMHLIYLGRHWRMNQNKLFILNYCHNVRKTWLTSKMFLWSKIITVKKLFLFSIFVSCSKLILFPFLRWVSLNLPSFPLFWVLHTSPAPVVIVSRQTAPPVIPCYPYCSQHLTTTCQKTPTNSMNHHRQNHQRL